MKERTVLVPTLIAAKNIDALNASFIDEEKDLDNGSIIAAGDYSKEQVYKTAEVSELHNLYMVCSPEDTIITDAMGNEYKIGINDPRTFTNVKGKVFSAFRPQVGDKVLMTLKGFDSETVKDYAIAEVSSNKLKFDDAAGEGLSFKVIDKQTYISIGGATNIGSQRVAAVLLECVAI